MKVAVVDPNYCDWIEVHKAGCQHLGKRKPVHYEFKADDREAVTKTAGADFVDDDGTNLSEVQSQIQFAPCLKSLS